MIPDRSHQIEDLFHKVIAQEPSERAAYLAKSCAGDPQLLAEVRPLLEAHETANGFLEKPLPDTLDKVFAEEQKSGLIRAEEEALVGKRIGPWKLARKIAAGGMGTVYLASRDDGSYQRQAAIKLIRPGIRFDEPQNRRRIIRQFREEQQLLADLDHPNIAKLLDGGTNEDGLPFLVMEYIEGLPITEYCQRHKLLIEERLRLFKKVCEAIQYAHGKLIAHLDLKPSNILVSPSPHPSAEPIPRLLDFGIARILKDETYDKSEATTGFGPQLMTLDYASPEQIRGEILGAHSDVYSLGVVLYETLTGQRPYDVNKFSAEWVIGREEPKRPSAVRKGLSRELDAIVLKAMAKDPARRYQSAASLAEDIDRYLTGRPLLAHPPSTLYLVGKFIARYQWTLFLLACGIGAGLVIGMSYKTAGEMEAERKQRELVGYLYYLGRSRFLQEDHATAEGILRRVIEIEEKLPPEPTPNPKGPWLPAVRRDLLAQCLMAQGKYTDETEKLMNESYPALRDYFHDQDKRVQDARDRLTLLRKIRGEIERTGQATTEPAEGHSGVRVATPDEKKPPA